MSMQFSTFAWYADRIDAKDADTEKLHLLAEALDVSGEDLNVAARFFQGEVFPEWDERKTSVGPSLMYTSLAKAAATEADEVEDIVADVGGAGAACEELEFDSSEGQQTLGSLGSSTVSLGTVYDRFAEIAQMSGSGSQARKTDALSDLLRSVEDETVNNETVSAESQAKYITRLVLGEMRIGVGSGTVRDAIADAFDVPVAAVERALMVSADAGAVAEMARTEGVDGLQSMELEVGRPVEAMLASKGTIEDAVSKWGKAVAEVKYDGARCVGPRTSIYTRNRGVTVAQYVEEGDEVLTHTGEYKRVTAKASRKMNPDEELYEFATQLGIPFKVTGDHKLRKVVNTGYEWTPVEDIDASEWVSFPVPKTSDEPLPETVELSNRANYTKTIPMDELFFRFLGFWVGGGSTSPEGQSKNYRVSLIFNNDQIELLEEYREIAHSLFNIDADKFGTYDHGGATSLYWADRPLMEWLCENFRKDTTDGWQGKTVPEWFRRVSPEQFDAFLQGWHDADGTGDEGEQQVITTKERTLASHVQLTGLSLGRMLGLRSVRIDGATYYRVCPIRTERDAKFANDGEIHVRVRKREHLSKTGGDRDVYPPRQTLYDFQVEDDSSFCTPMVAAHNCQLHKDGDEVTLFTRGLEDETDSLPDVVDIVLDRVDADEVILDGEVVAYEDEEDEEPLPFTEVMKRLGRKHDVGEKRDEIAVNVHVFDVLYKDGETLLTDPLRERQEYLDDICPTLASERIVSDDPDEIKAFEAEALANEHEGIMLKNPDSKFSAGKRGQNWLKVKPDIETLDCVVVGGEMGEGRRQGVIGSYLLAVHDADGELKTIGKVATGLTDEKLETLHNRFESLIKTRDGKDLGIQPEIVFEVGYEEIYESPEYTSGYGLRFPRFLGVREDKRVSDADSVERVENILD